MVTAPRRTVGTDWIDELPVRPAWGYMHPDGASPYDDSVLAYVTQLGVEDVLVDIHDRLMGTDALDYRQLLLLKNGIEDAGLRLNAIEQPTNPEYEKSTCLAPVDFATVS